MSVNADADRPEPEQSIAAERAVRDYLLFVRDPSSLVDQQRVATLRAEAAGADDVIARLKATSQAIRAERPDENRLRADFVGTAG